MANVKIYTKSYCPHCHATKALFDTLGVEYEEENVEDPDKQDRLVQRTGHFTVPQVFINDEFIGGNDDLQALQASGELKTLLEGEGN